MWAFTGNTATAADTQPISRMLTQCGVDGFEQVYASIERQRHLHNTSQTDPAVFVHSSRAALMDGLLALAVFSLLIDA
jgi:hypothetical protein